MALAILIGLAIGHVAAQTPDTSGGQSVDDAWWTGPLLAASPATLPQGHWLVEPYLYDSIVDKRFDPSGNRYSVGHQNDFGSQSYIEYGLSDAITIGAIPRFGYRETHLGDSSVRLGDLTLQSAFRVARYSDADWIPAIALVIAETLPTGEFDRLDSHPENGFGSGAYTTAISVYSQYPFWMPSGRILRLRLDLTQSWSNADVHLAGSSVYGTSPGFSGTARLGATSTADLSLEYSLTKNWVVATDVVYEYDKNTRITGHYPEALGNPFTSTILVNSGPSRALSVAPAVEYNFTNALGVIVGMKVTASGRNVSAPITPVAALNLVF